MKRFRTSIAFLILVTGFAVTGLSQVGSSTPPPKVCTQPTIAVVAVAPKFPEIARKARVTKIFSVDVTIDAFGWVTGARLPDGTHDILTLGEVSLRAAKRWRFNEAYGCNERSAKLEFYFRPPVPVGWGPGTVFKPPFVVEIVEEEIEVHAVS